MDATLPLDYLTPPSSAHSSSPREEDRTLIMLSTTFFPGADIGQGGLSADIVLHSADSVFFYVHRAVLQAASSNGFNGHLNTMKLPLPSKLQPQNTAFPVAVASHPSFIQSPLITPPDESLQDNTEQDLLQVDSTPLPTIIALPEHSTIINIVLHLLYKLSCERYNPTLGTIAKLFPLLTKYGLSASDLIAPISDIPRILLSYAPIEPIEVYAIAAANGLHSLAVLASQYTLTVPLWSMTDVQANAMGPIYLKRLMFLHMGRAEALKRVLTAPPEYHVPTETCTLDSQKAVTRAWSLATAYVLHGAQGTIVDSSSLTSGHQLQGVSTTLLDTVFSPLVQNVGCPACKESLRTRISALVHDWSLVKSTI
ncbi:hypothetical protein FRC02_008817 [Tulasnella sp. 418]|nr:hypothetical protein FRC02_008817 [Tulasnella sp. 418]